MPWVIRPHGFWVKPVVDVSASGQSILVAIRLTGLLHRLIFLGNRLSREVEIARLAESLAGRV